MGRGHWMGRASGGFFSNQVAPNFTPAVAPFLMLVTIRRNGTSLAVRFRLKAVLQTGENASPRYIYDSAPGLRQPHENRLFGGVIALQTRENRLFFARTGHRVPRALDGLHVRAGSFWSDAGLIAEAFGASPH